MLLGAWSVHGALVALALGDAAGAKERIARAVRPHDTPFIGQRVMAGQVAALLARHDGDAKSAETFAQDMLTTAAEHGHLREILNALEILAGLAAVQGAWTHAARLAGAAQATRDAHPIRGRLEPLATLLTADLAATRAALGEAPFEAAWAEGQALPLNEAVAFAQRMRGDRSRPTLGWASLTPTEHRVVDLAREGRTNAAIAKELLMGAETVKSHLSRVYAKLGVANRTQLAGLTPPA